MSTTQARDGTAIWWEMEGDGPPVLLIPGRGDSSDLFPEMFRAQLREAGAAALRFAPRDTGLSGDGGDKYTLRTMADDAVAVLDAAGVASAHVVGVSMAGMLMVDLASRVPQRIASLTFVAAMSPDPEAGFGEDFFAVFDQEPLDAQVGAMGETTEADRAWAAEHLAAAAQRAAPRPDALDRHQAAAMRFGWPTFDDLDRVQAPTAVVHGTLDRVLPVTHGQAALARHIGGATLTVLDTMGHIPRPADWRTIAGIVAQLARLPSAAG